MITTWKIINLKRKPDTGLVFEVEYIINFELENKIDTYTGIVELEGNASDSNFILFDELTEETVINWVQNKMGNESIQLIETEMQNYLQQMIDKEKNPDFLKGIPW